MVKLDGKMVVPLREGMIVNLCGEVNYLIKRLTYLCRPGEMEH